MTEQEPSGFVGVERHENYSELVLNRPERRNAVTGPLVQELGARIEELAGAEAGNVVLLRGNGAAFCSGLDLKEFAADPPPDWMPGFAEQWEALHRTMYHFPGIFVCALERFAINAGAALALACDVVIVGKDSYLQVGEARMGRTAPMNFAWLYLRGGRQAVTEAAIRAQRIPGDELLRLGLAHDVVPDAEVVDAARERAADLATIPHASVAGMKQTLRAFEKASGVGDPFALSRAQP